MIGERIREYREIAKLTQEELAEKVNVQRNTVWRWENGKASPMESIAKIALALNVSVAVLLGEPPSAQGGQGSRNIRFDSNVRPTSVTWIPITSPNIKACCGHGNSYYAEDMVWDVIGEYPIPDSFLLGYSWQVNGKFMTMYVEGDSMEPRIHDGDLILFASLPISDGDTALVRYRDRLIVRYVRFEKGEPARLEAANDEYEDLLIDLEDEDIDFCILGKVLLRLPRAEKVMGLF